MNTTFLKKLASAAIAAVVLSAGSVSAQQAWLCPPSPNDPCTFEAHLEDGTLTITGKGTGIMPDFVPGITGGSNAPWANYRYSNIIIDENITYIGDFAFASLEGLSYVRSLATTPPTLGEYVFGNTLRHERATLFVPEEAESAYRAADVWKDFAEINPTTEFFTVEFDLQGGSGYINPQSVPSGERATQPAQQPNRPGFAFMGWCIGSDIPESVCAVDWNFNTDVVTSDITLYAKWEPASPRTVTFESSNEIWTIDIDPQEVAYGGKVTKPTPDPEPLSQNYRFDGWYKEAECINAWDFENEIVTSNITLYAKWVSTNSILTADREVPQVEEVVIVAPIDRASLSLSVGPNPAERQAGVVNIYLAGATVQSGNLTIFDANGNVVRRLTVDSDVITWDLRDSRGRLVVEGSYLVRGSVRTASGTSERVSVVLGVR